MLKLTVGPNKSAAAHVSMYQGCPYNKTKAAPSLIISTQFPDIIFMKACRLRHFSHDLNKCMQITTIFHIIIIKHADYDSFSQGFHVNMLISTEMSYKISHNTHFIIIIRRPTVGVATRELCPIYDPTSTGFTICQRIYMTTC